ncbi:2-dehydropantoate 2-reductase [Salinisphaera sp. SPP-AMP-43]|uniref:ketopantoate reductase family protein n=1 Tax=Salinisphaera sp. SPP-AMP-43 TaxID=3121288 RepID=UPI003C6E0E88
MADKRLGRWHIIGAGRIGSLAAHYLQQAGAEILGVRPGPAHRRRIELVFDSASAISQRPLELPIQPPLDCEPISQLLVACKTPYSAAALARVRLTDDATVVRLQNGLGSLDGLLAPGQRLIEGVTASAVMSAGDGRLRVVAENATFFGGGPRPAWFDALAAHWPMLAWADDIRPPQWRKLIANAVLNPLTALHDVPNGALLERDDLQTEMQALVAEADAVLARLDPGWPADSYDRVAEVASATAANTSSMRADIHAGAITEIEAINGWLLQRAAELGLDLPTHRRIVAAVHALEPD